MGSDWMNCSACLGIRRFAAACRLPGPQREQKGEHQKDDASSDDARLGNRVYQSHGPIAGDDVIGIGAAHRLDTMRHGHAGEHQGDGGRSPAASDEAGKCVGKAAAAAGVARRAAQRPDVKGKGEINDAAGEQTGANEQAHRPEAVIVGVQERLDHPPHGIKHQRRQQGIGESAAKTAADNLADGFTRAHGAAGADGRQGGKVADDEIDEAVRDVAYPGERPQPLFRCMSQYLPPFARDPFGKCGRGLLVPDAARRRTDPVRKPDSAADYW